MQPYFKINKKSHWLQVSANKLHGDQSGIMKMPNGFFGQNLQKRSKTEKKHHYRILHLRNSLQSWS